MSEYSRKEYFRVLAERYRSEGTKKGRSQIIDEACKNTGLHRKSVIRAFWRSIVGHDKIVRVGRPRKFSEGAIFALKRLYRESDYQCSGKLHSMIPILIEQLNLQLSKEVLIELKSISQASIDRYLKKYRKLQSVKKRTFTRKGSRVFRRMIPLKSLSNIAQSPGVMEADTVGHCGESAAGEFAFSLTMTDEFTGWTRNGAMVNKSAIRVQPVIERLVNELPFDLSLINFDNGSEFLNHVVHGYFVGYAKRKGFPFPMTRSRSYHKNDNPRAEQKNWTHVRQLFGYDRIDDIRLVDLMNEIYEVQNLIQNFFIPQYKLKSKVRVGAKIKKKYDKPKTPYQRLLESTIPEENKQKLRDQYASLNYSDLKRKREELLNAFIKLQEKIKLEKRAL
ncbi:MAG: hypothetical protein M9962_13120 [Oligoflexia bacterium]|nr:hypothetical protein [Oligoflexia bacterium]